MEFNMPVNDKYTCLTLVDITKTGAVRHYNKAMSEDRNVYSRKRNQHRNWETVIQVINLRAQPIYLTDPVKLDKQDLSKYGFGSNFTGMHTVWEFSFGSEHEGVFDLPGNPGGAFVDAVHHVPIVIKLDETATFTIPAFDSTNAVDMNILITKG